MHELNSVLWLVHWRHVTAEYNLIYPSQGTGSNKSFIPLINIHLVSTTFLFYLLVS